MSSSVHRLHHTLAKWYREGPASKARLPVGVTHLNGKLFRHLLTSDVLTLERVRIDTVAARTFAALPICRGQAWQLSASST